MKSSKLVLGLLGLIIFCLLLLGGAAYFKNKQVSNSSNIITNAPIPPSPEKVTKDFYKWYIEECLSIDSNLKIGTQWQKCSLEKNSAINGEFIKKLNDAPAKAFDPILCEVEIPESFTAAIDDTLAEGVEVNVSKFGAEDSSSHTVILKNFDNEYKITNIICSN